MHNSNYKLKKKIYINGRFLTQPITGVQRYSHEFCKALDELIEINSHEVKEYDFELIAPSKGHLHKPELKRIPLKKIGILSGHLWEQLELPFYTKGGLLFSPGNTTSILNLILKRRNVVTLHDLSYKYFPDAYSFPFKLVYKILIPLILKYSNRVITVSNSEKQSILKHYPSAQKTISFVQNGGFSKNYIDKIESRKINANTLHQPYLLYVGALNKRKNLQGIIEALKLIKDKCDLNLIIVGASGKSFAGFDNFLSNDIKGRVIFTGQINDTEKLISYYLGAKAFVFPSFYEASPLPPIEAMTCGIPVISSSIPSLKERCENAAIYCDAENHEDIAQKILEIVRDESLAISYSEKGKLHSAKYTWEKCVRSTLKEISECI